jgi:hypothetical protein
MALNKAAFNFQLQGFPAANRDATVRLTNEATGQTLERKPFLDGSLLVRDLDPGMWQVQVVHPNLINAIDQRRIRLFPQPVPTFVPIPIPENLFKDSPIRDVPDADLGPVQQTATAARSSLAPIATKGAGEVIRASDWNTLVGTVSDLAGAVLQLAALVAPRGHDHPEIAEKIDEVQENLRRFADAYGRSLLELRREIEAENLRRAATDVLDQAGATPEVRDRLLGRIEDLRKTVQVDTPLFTQKLATTGTVLLTEINTLAQAQGAEADAFRAQPAVQQLTLVAQQYSTSGTQVRPESELQTYARTTTVSGGIKLGRLLKG